MPPFDPTPDVTSPNEQGHGRHRPRATAPTPQPDEPVRRLPVEPVRVCLDLDLAPATVEAGYARKYLDFVELNSTPQRAALKLLFSTLRARRIELLDGTRIEHESQAVQWLLERIALELPMPLLDEFMEGAH